MTYSSLKRKTPLRAKSPLKTNKGLVSQKEIGCGKLSDKECKSTSKRTKGGFKPKKHDKGNLVEHLDRVFSLYIRLRDAMYGGATRCISCGGIFPFEKMQCGHFFTRHNMSVRWDERNCSSQCADCNCNKSGNIEEYKRWLIVKIGKDEYEELNEKARQSAKWSDAELKDMIRHYTEEVRKLSRTKGVSVNI